MPTITIFKQDLEGLLAAPEIGAIAILQLNSQFAGVGILPLQLTLHEHQ
jgi:hypothetical protein